VGHVAHMGELTIAYKILVRKPQGKRPTRRWEDNTGMGRCGLDSSGSGHGPVAGSCEHGNEPSGSIIKGGEFLY
jgi:hypothetical protein